MGKRFKDLEEKLEQRLPMSFWEHLDELRARLIKVILVFLVAACVFYSTIDRVLAFIIQPVGHLVFTTPSEAFVARINLSLWGGFFLSLPFTVYQIWEFVAVGLREREKKYVLFFGPCSLFFFIFGALFAYLVAIPMALKFLLSFSSDIMVPMITVKNYISFVGSFMLGFGVVFELPLVLMFLVKIGIATPAFLIEKRRHAIVILLIISAILTPTADVISLLIMAVPLIILYEIGILFARMTYNPHAARELN